MENDSDRRRRGLGSAMSERTAAITAAWRAVHLPEGSAHSDWEIVRFIALYDAIRAYDAAHPRCEYGGDLCESAVDPIINRERCWYCPYARVEREDKPTQPPSKATESGRSGRIIRETLTAYHADTLAAPTSGADPPWLKQAIYAVRQAYRNAPRYGLPAAEIADAVLRVAVAHLTDDAVVEAAAETQFNTERDQIGDTDATWTSAADGIKNAYRVAARDVLAAAGKALMGETDG